VYKNAFYYSAIVISWSDIHGTFPYSLTKKLAKWIVFCSRSSQVSFFTTKST